MLLAIIIGFVICIAAAVILGMTSVGSGCTGPVAVAKNTGHSSFSTVPSAATAR